MAKAKTDSGRTPQQKADALADAQARGRQTLELAEQVAQNGPGGRAAALRLRTLLRGQVDPARYGERAASVRVSSLGTEEQSLSLTQTPAAPAPMSLGLQFGSSSDN